MPAVFPLRDPTLVWLLLRMASMWLQSLRLIYARLLLLCLLRVHFCDLYLTARAATEHRPHAHSHRRAHKLLGRILIKRDIHIYRICYEPDAKALACRAEHRQLSKDTCTSCPYLIVMPAVLMDLRYDRPIYLFTDWQLRPRSWLMRR